MDSEKQIIAKFQTENVEPLDLSAGTVMDELNERLEEANFFGNL